AVVVHGLAPVRPALRLLGFDPGAGCGAGGDLRLGRLLPGVHPTGRGPHERQVTEVRGPAPAAAVEVRGEAVRVAHGSVAHPGPRVGLTQGLARADRDRHALLAFSVWPS